jgi:hypothetical protein
MSQQPMERTLDGSPSRAQELPLSLASPEGPPVLVNNPIGARTAVRSERSRRPGGRARL